MVFILRATGVLSPGGVFRGGRGIFRGGGNFSTGRNFFREEFYAGGEFSGRGEFFVQFGGKFSGGVICIRWHFPVTDCVILLDDLYDIF